MDKKIKEIPNQDLMGERLFEIIALQSLSLRNALINHPHRQKCQKLMYIKSGQGKHIIDDRVFTFKSNTFYLIGNGQVHDYIETSKLSGFMIRFKDNFLPPSGLNSQNSVNSNLINRIIQSNELTIPTPQVEHYEALLDELNYEYAENEQTYAKTALLQYLLLALLTKLERRIRHASQDKITLTTDHNTKIFHSFLILIEDYFRHNHQIAFYADKLAIDKRKLTTITKRSSGRKPKEILNERLITEGKRLLLYTTDTSKEISYSLGFEDPAYFSRFFKVHTKQSPKQFKESKSKLVL